MPRGIGTFYPTHVFGQKIITSRKTLIVRVKFIFRIKVTIANDIFIMQYIKIYFKFNPKNTFLWWAQTKPKSTMKLTTGIYKPYRKPNDKPLYIHKDSNHPLTHYVNYQKWSANVWTTSPPMKKCLKKLYLHTKKHSRRAATNTYWALNRQSSSQRRDSGKETSHTTIHPSMRQAKWTL